MPVRGYYIPQIVKMNRFWAPYPYHCVYQGKFGEKIDLRSAVLCQQFHFDQCIMSSLRGEKLQKLENLYVNVDRDVRR